MTEGSMLRRPLARGDRIDWWQLSRHEEQIYRSPPEPMPASTRSRFVNAFEGVGELPCRRLFRSLDADRPIAVPDDLVWEEHLLGAAGGRIELSWFWHRPTHVWRWARTTIEVETAGAYALRLETCGGARLWVGGHEAARFTPFIRNKPEATEVELSLRAGRNDVLLLLDELCERDTTWYVELTWIDERPAVMGVAAPGGAELLDQLRGQAGGMRLDREAYDRESIRLLLPMPAQQPMAATLSYGGHDNVAPTLPGRRVGIAGGATVIDLGSAATVSQGYHPLRVVLEAGGMRIGRRLAAGFTGACPAPEAAADPEARRRQALEHLARNGGSQLGRALALAATGGDPALIAAILARTLDRIETREDCSDFWLVPLLCLWRTRPSAFVGPLRERTQAAILGYRYWMDEPGDDVMWFWSENHALCFHTAQYLAGRMLPDEIFGCSGRGGHEQAEIGRDRLRAWLAEAEAHGFVEWNSPAYYPIDAIGLLALHQHAVDADIKESAGRCLDRIFMMTALSTLDGIPSSTQGRSYARDLKFPALTETASLAWIEWGRGHLGSLAYAAPLLCLGAYRAPEAARRLALWDRVDGIEARYCQGPDRAARLVAWKSGDALLGSVVGYHTGQPGYQAVVSQLQLAGHPDARVWINNPGEDDPFGSRRPSYWAGDGFMPRVAQWRGLVLLHYRLDDPRAIPWTHAYARHDVFDERRVEGSWLFLRSGRALAAIWAANGLEPVTAGACADYELRSSGRHNSWLMRAGSVERFGSLDAFAAAMRVSLREVVAGELVALEDPEHGRVSLDWAGRLTVADIDRPHDVGSFDPVVTGEDGGAPRW